MTERFAPPAQLTSTPETRALELLARGVAREFSDTSVFVQGRHCAGPTDATLTLHLNSPALLGEVLRAPRGLGLARAWVKGYLDLEGDLVSIASRETELRRMDVVPLGVRATLSHLVASSPRPFRGTGPSESEFRGRTGRQSSRSSAESIGYHYNLDPAFFRIVLGETMVYSGSMPVDEHSTLAEAQYRKLDVLVTKLALEPGQRLLDVGCGWGSLLKVAAERYDLAAVHGLTASVEQAAHATQALAPFPAAQVWHRDWRQIDETYDRIASVGMYEHVGRRSSVDYFRKVHGALSAEGRYVHQSIVRRPDRPKNFRRNSFAQRYVFPDGQIATLDRTVGDIEKSGFEVLDVEAFGLSYAWTLSEWRRNLEANREEVVELIGAERFRAWRLYLAGSQLRFESGALDVVQIVSTR